MFGCWVIQSVLCCYSPGLAIMWLDIILWHSDNLGKLTRGDICTSRWFTVCVMLNTQCVHNFWANIFACCAVWSRGMWYMGKVIKPNGWLQVLKKTFALACIYTSLVNILTSYAHDFLHVNPHVAHFVHLQTTACSVLCVVILSFLSLSFSLSPLFSLFIRTLTQGLNNGISVIPQCTYHLTWSKRIPNNPLMVGVSWLHELQISAGWFGLVWHVWGWVVTYEYAPDEEVVSGTCFSVAKEYVPDSYIWCSVDMWLEW